ncbi:TonB-dependent receptor plug domain-containing protein [Plebeiibacterium sediminum]|uniref:TonB-dependent receptor n=1 Tax=Plebeiibacterium sediminum TaxID=2992112 RepID=A0AAE3M4X9_9BACT|nr:TonB-dependent receptor [Plebeiobacterium sediminum]MCW3786905.1 TonB-dependent receptor [Plebeiobacterium sediminum]
MKNWLFLFVIFIGHYSVGLTQDMARDTMHIVEVEIIESRRELLSDTERKITIDTSQMHNYLSTDVSYLLSKTSLVNILNYGGEGAQSSISIRGGGSSHTSVLWNGLPINSLTTGGADLSMVNVRGFDEINVIYGASGSVYGSGTFGGVVELNNLLDFHKKKEFNVNAGYGSFSNQKYGFQARVASGQVTYSGQLFVSKIKNDFKYTDQLELGHPTETLTHNQTEGYGMIHNANFKLGKNYLNVGLWYQVKDNNIPGTMGRGKPVSYQNQIDSTLKIAWGYKRVFNNIKAEYQSGWIRDYMLYTDKDPVTMNYRTYSEIGSYRWLNSINTRFYLNDRFDFDVLFRYNYLIGDVTAYQKKVYEHEGGLSVSGRYLFDHSKINISLSQDLNTETSPPLMFSLGGLHQLLSQHITLRGKFGTHYRRPTFNERYWIPGGNVNLKSEKGYGFEFGADWKKNINASDFVLLKTSFFLTNNEEMILWMPTLSGNSEPQNSSEVMSRGIEVDFHWLKTLGKSDLNFYIRYGFNDSYYNDESDVNYKQNLAYKPKHIIRTNVVYGLKNLDLSLNNSFQSKTEATSGWLMKEVFLTDVICNYRFKSLHLEGQFKVENVFNESYQMVYAYPMPGRNYYIGINYKF